MTRWVVCSTGCTTIAMNPFPLTRRREPYMGGLYCVSPGRCQYLPWRNSLRPPEGHHSKMIGDIEHEVETRHFAVDTEGVLAGRQWFEHDVEALICGRKIRPRDSCCIPLK